MTAAQDSLRCPGMHDLGPEEMARFRRIEEVFRASCESWGFREIRTPVVEHLHLFTSAGTLSPQMLGRVYSFLDWDGWSGERVVLRPDGTIPAARLYWERYRGEIAKLFYVENLFRFAASGERREVWQCGAELIGESWPAGDLEVIAVVRGVLRRLGFERLTLRLSHTGIIRSILATAGYSPEEQLALYDRLIDGDPSVWPEIAGALPQTGAPLTMLRDLTGGQVHGLANLQSALGPTLPAIVPPIEELRTIASSLELAGCSYELDLTIVRGFEYYTGPVFQVLIDGENVAGGGRYDGLIASQEGHSVPACGFAISIEPLLDRLDNPRPGEEINLIDVSIAGRSPSVLASALGLVTELHEQGYDAELVAQPLFKGRWTIEVSDRDGRAAYRLRDLTAGSSFDAATVNEVTQRIERGARA
jgi:histidyl-tRNA synthetase